jgi:hypothetical protein
MVSVAPASKNGRPKFGGTDVSEATRLKTLEDENTRLKRLLANAMLDNAALKTFWVRSAPAAKRKAVAHLVDVYGMSERRACKAVGCCRKTMRYKAVRADDAGLRQRMRAIAQERRRFGYRRACTCCSTTRSSSGSTGRRSSWYAAVAAASGQFGPGHR